MPDSSLLHHYRKGEHLSATTVNALIDACRRGSLVPLTHQDTTGTYTRRRAGGAGRLEKYFELYDELNPGSSALAYVRNWRDDPNDDGYTGDAGYVSDDAFETDSDEKDTRIMVYDVLDMYRGRGRGDYLDEHGSYGMAVRRHGRWEIQQLQPNALLLVAQVDMEGGLGSTDERVVVKNVSMAFPTGGLFLDEVTSVANVHNWAADDDARLEAYWNDTTEDWEMIQVDCPVPEA